MKESLAIACFVKTPGLSPIKKRLAAGVGEQFATEIYRRSCLAIQSVLIEAEKSIPGTNVYWCVAEEEGCANKMWNMFPSIHQGEGDLGTRMKNVNDQLKDGFETILFMDTSTPQISPQLLHKATDFMTRADAVIGATREDSFYVAMLPTHLPPHFWEHLGDATSMKLGQQLDAADQHVCWMPQLAGVNTEFDLMLLQEDLINNVEATGAQDDLADLLRMRSSLS